MRATRHGAYLTQITQFPKFFPINIYLVRESDGFTLIDSGMQGAAKGCIDAAHEAGLPIQRILITHAHGDHIGSLDDLHALLPQAEVLLTQRQVRMLHGDRDLDAGEPHTKVRGSFNLRTTPASRIITAGETIGSLLSVAAPGHTPDHIAFFDTRDGSLIGGDAFQTQGGIAVSGTLRVGFPWPTFGTWNRPIALQTARALRTLNPMRLAVGHGPVLEHPLAAMDAAIVAAKGNRNGTKAFA